MKNLSFLLLLLVLVSCATYKPYVNVQTFTVPKGSKEIIFQGTLDSMKAVFNRNSILFSSKENGIETDQILLDQGTRAKYQVVQFEGKTLKMIPFWGITDAVKAKMTVWAGMEAASAYSTESWDRVIYDTPKSRPSMVFHYGIQLAKEVNPNLSYK